VVGHRDTSRPGYMAVVYSMEGSEHGSTASRARGDSEMSDLERVITVSDRPNVALTVADVLQYIIPGGTFLISCLLFELRARLAVRQELGEVITIHTPLLTALELAAGHYNSAANSLVVTAPSGGTDWVFAVFVGLGILAAAYAVGHVIASYSALLVDRVLVAKGHGYPFANLLNTTPDAHEETKRRFYRGLFFWFNLVLFCEAVVIALATANHSPVLLEWFLRAVFIAVVVGVVAKAMLKKTTEPQWAARLLGSFVKPYDWIAAGVSRAIETKRGFDPEFVNVFWCRFKNVFGEQLMKRTDPSTNTFWLTYCHVTASSPVFRAALDNWLKLYIFSRNLATALFCAFIYCTFWYWLHSGATFIYWTELTLWQPIGDPRAVESAAKGLALLPFTLLIAGYIMLVRYYYLYYAYFSKFVFRAFVYLTREARAAAGTADSPPVLSPVLS
jgi:hypothetical protein